MRNTTNNTTTNNNNVVKGSNLVLPIFNEKRPTSLKSNWANDNASVNSYGFKKEEVTEIWKSKGKSIALMIDGTIKGFRNFPPEGLSNMQEHREYISFTASQISEALPDKEEGARQVKMFGLMSGSTGIFGSSFLACKSLTGKSGRYINKESQKVIASKFEELLKEGK